MARKILVKAEWDPEAKVWVATSDDVEGLVTEAETVEKLVEKLSVMIPELIEANRSFEEKDEVREIPFSLITHCERLISLHD